MKPITLHPASVLAGLALAGVLTVLAGATQSAGTVHQIPIHDVRLVGEIPAEWWTYVALSTAPDGTPIDSYTVPLDRHFVVTSCVGTFVVGVLADGQHVDSLLAAVNQGSGRQGNGTRVPFPPGTLLTASSGVGPAAVYLWGYLEPLR